MERYGSIENGTLHPAPRAFMLHGAMVTNPKAEHFAALNVEREKKGLPPYLPIVDTPPTTDSAHYAVATGWAEQGGEIVRQYEVREVPPPPPRRWTPLAIKRACGERWSVLRAALDALGVLDDFLMAQELREDDEAFARGRARAVEKFGEEAVEAVLKEAAHG